MRFLDAGILIGIATGRGKSIRALLCDKIGDLDLQSRVVVGYYNGADVGLLIDDSHPDQSENPCDALRSVAEALAAAPQMLREVRCTIRPWQLTLEHDSATAGTLVWDVVQQVVHMVAPHYGLSVVRSGHSVDILAPGVSKHTLVDHVRGLVGHRQGSVLCIGDQGQWPGNDYALLAEPFSLSVDTVSSDPQTCWNLAVPGYRGVQALLGYLSSVSIQGDTARITMHNHEKVQ